MDRRVVIVDFSHMAHVFRFGASPLSVRVCRGGFTENVDTTIPSGTIKNIHKWSNGGINPTVVCFDRKCVSREEYFKSLLEKDEGEKTRYKGGRGKKVPELYEGIELSERILSAGGVACLYRENYEADDIVYACVLRAKRDYPGIKVDVVTNDTDLLPLVDEDVSVFLRSRKSTWAEDERISKNKYVQVTPNNYESIVEELTAYKGFSVPYNTILLHKLLRGDKSDNIAGKRGFTPTKYNNLIKNIIDNGEDLSIFRYGECCKRYYRDGKEICYEEAKRIVDSGGSVERKYYDPEELTEITGVLEKYGCSEDEIEHVMNTYRGVNLNTYFGSITRF